MPTEHPNVVLSRQHFDLMADQYDELFVTHMHDYDITHEMVLTMLPLPRESALRVLELGTGTGNLTQKLLDLFPQSTLVGYDVSAEMLARARAKLARAGTRVQLHQGDISQIAFPAPPVKRRAVCGILAKVTSVGVQGRQRFRCPSKPRQNFLYDGAE